MFFSEEFEEKYRHKLVAYLKLHPNYKNNDDLNKLIERLEKKSI